MDVIGDTRSRCFSQIEPHVEPTRFIDLAENNFGTLRELHQFAGAFDRNRSQRGKVLVGHDHQMACGVRISIEAYKAVQAAMDDVNCLFRNLAGHSLSDSVVNGGDHVAEDAVLVLALVGGHAERAAGTPVRDSGSSRVM